MSKRKDLAALLREVGKLRIEVEEMRAKNAHLEGRVDTHNRRLQDVEDTNEALGGNHRALSDTVTEHGKGLNALRGMIDKIHKQVFPPAGRAAATKKAPAKRTRK